MSALRSHLHSCLLDTSSFLTPERVRDGSAVGRVMLTIPLHLPGWATAQGAGAEDRKRKQAVPGSHACTMIIRKEGKTRLGDGFPCRSPQGVYIRKNVDDATITLWTIYFPAQSPPAAGMSRTEKQTQGSSPP